MTESLRVRVEIENEDDLPGFGAYLSGSALKGKAIIRINFSALFSAIVDNKEIPVTDWKQIAADGVVHELLHAVEDFLGKAFSEVDVEGLIQRARTNLK